MKELEQLEKWAYDLRVTFHKNLGFKSHEDKMLTRFIAKIQELKRSLEGLKNEST